MSDPTPAPAPAEPTPAAPAPAPQPTPAPGPAPASAGNDRTPIESLPGDVQEYIRTLRGEAKTYREERDTFKGQIDTLTPYQQQVEALRASLTGEGGKAPATADELQKQIEATQTEAQQAKQEADAARRGLALVRVASLPDVQVNASRLLDSKSFEAKLAQVDPADEAGLRALLTAEAEADQTLRIVPIAGGSGGGVHGGATPTPGRPGLKDAIAARQQQATGRR
jgi:pyruvate dehydrogenase E2 component (dihydrolipoamide acetyltransferase)